MRQPRRKNETRFKINQRMIGSMLLLLLSAAFGSILAGAQQTEPSLPLSQRLTINLASGMPEYVADASSVSSAPQSNWWFENTRNN